ncbi:glycosyltransferase [Alteromonadaceae bacterium BrNp21-10]|nr:glycosyltransferase [Alteromonadaceae bacterium BrNp21-10]
MIDRISTSANQVLISIILPVYNCELYVTEAVKSILDQTETRFELIIIDDGSTDKSLVLLKQFKDSRVVLISRENRGLIETLNEGIKLSKGRLIARMDADDISSPLRLEKQLLFFNSNPNVALCCLSLTKIDSNGVKIGENTVSNTYFICKEELLFGNPIAHPTVMLNTAVIPKDKIYYDKKYIHAEDFELWCRIIKEHKAVKIEQSLFKYRVHAKSVSSLNMKVQRESSVNAIKNNYLDSNRLANIENIDNLFNHNQLMLTYFATIIAMLKIILASLSERKLSTLVILRLCARTMRVKIRKRNKASDIRSNLR